jgi:dTDP-glucose pyrophosphorylase
MLKGALIVVTENASIRDAMTAINFNGREMVIVQDVGHRVLGLITDGDIRRGLLSGHTLESPAKEIMKGNFFSVDSSVDRAAVLDLMKARGFQHVPVLDRDRRLIAIHFLRDLIGAAPKPNIAVIMAGGRGIRLGPITETIPKPMVEVAGRSMLERIVLHLVGHGVTTIYLAVNYLADVIERHFGEGTAFGCQIRYLRESKPLGTGGPLSLLEDRPAHPLFVLNGDLVMRADLSAMLDVHVTGGYAATVAVGTHQVQIPYAAVAQLDGRLVALEEKPTLNLLVNRGIYVIDPNVLELVPQGEEFPITMLFEMLLRQGRPVGIFHFDDYWLDVGRPHDLRYANGWF